MNFLKLDEKQKERFGCWYPVARNAVVVSGIFILAVGVLVLSNVFQLKKSDPLNAPGLKRMIETAHRVGADEEMLQTIREMDLLARKAYFTSVAFSRFGGFLLLGGALVFLLSLKAMFELKRSPPRPGELSGAPDSVGVHLERSIVVVVLLLAAAAWIVPRAVRNPLDAYRHEGDRKKEEKRRVSPDVVRERFPGEEAMRRNWPSFRGFRGLGVAGPVDPPAAWDTGSGRNIRWKTKLPKKGFNSPVVWENRVFMSGADPQSREVYCLDLETGRMLWKVATRVQEKITMPEVTEDTGLAAPTLATNGLRVAALFATGELLVLDFQGNRLWEKKLETPENHYGHSSSLLAYRDLLWIQYDHNGGGRVMAFRLSDGELAWERSRPFEISWASPILAPAANGDQLILAAPPGLAAYEPLTGEILWTSGEIMNGELGSSPAFDGNRVFLGNQYAILTCLDVQNREVLWEYDDHLPDASSPVAHDGLLILPSSYGTVSCFDAATGELLWQNSYDTGYYASPIVAGKNVFLADKKGTVRIFRLERSFQEVSSPSLGEGCVSTPAFTGDVMVIRGMEHCFCIEKGAS